MALFSSTLQFCLRIPRQCSRSVFLSSRRTTLVQTERQLKLPIPNLFCNNQSVIELQQRFYITKNSPSQWYNTFQLSRNWSRLYHFTSFQMKRYGNKRQFDISSINKRFKSEVQKTETKQPDKQPSVFQRFKAAYKEHGKILIGVHIVTSVVWFALFYVAAKEGVDVIPLMERLGFSETIIKPFRNPSLGNLALAYLIYELAKPVRYAATLFGTNIVIKTLRKRGKMASQHEPIRRLAKDSRIAVTQNLKKRGLTVKQRIGKRRMLLQQRLGKRRFWLRERTNKFSQRVRGQLKDFRRRTSRSKLMNQFKRKRLSSRK